MIRTKLVESLDELMSLMPLFLDGYAAMNKKKKVFEVDIEGYTKTLVGVLNTAPKNSILVLYVDNEAVGFGVGFDETPAFAKQQEMLLWALYVKPEFRGDLVVRLFEDGVQVAKANGYSVLKAYNSRFTGGMYRFFEQKLGMRRNRVQFNYNL